MRDGSLKVVTSGGETLTGQPALDYVAQAQEAYVTAQQTLNQARGVGTLTADVVQATWDKLDATYGSIATIEEAIAAIDNDAKSGIIYNMLPNVTQASASLRNAMDRMGLDVISSVTFGALSAAEMNLAMETAVPRNLAPPELRAWLVAKRDAQAKAVDALQGAVRYLSKPGNTISGWMDARPAATPTEPPAEPPAANRSDEELFEQYGVGK